MVPWSDPNMLPFSCLTLTLDTELCRVNALIHLKRTRMKLALPDIKVVFPLINFLKTGNTAIQRTIVNVISAVGIKRLKRRINSYRLLGSPSHSPNSSRKQTTEKIPGPMAKRNRTLEPALPLGLVPFPSVSRLGSHTTYNFQEQEHFAYITSWRSSQPAPQRLPSPNECQFHIPPRVPCRLQKTKFFLSRTSALIFGLVSSDPFYWMAAIFPGFRPQTSWD